MVNLKSLWIGDKVTITGNNQIGIFEGLNNEGLAEVKVGGNVLLFKNNELDEFKEIELTSHDLDFLIEEKKPLGLIKQPTPKLKSEIDLHINVLAPDYENSHPATIIEFQLSKLKTFVENAIKNKQPTITIIHGKGEGKLRDYVHQYLESIHQTKWKILKNRDGATEVWFEYL